VRPELSVYLDVVRVSAAMVVFLGHLSGKRLTGGFLWQFDAYMSEAVTVFFVLSGFLIAYVTDGRETTAKSYAASRLARIYSVALPALVLTFVLDLIGRTINPSVYLQMWGYQPEGLIWQFLSGLTFVHEVWFLHVPQGSDIPYWSMGYEVWYYGIFGLLLYTPRPGPCVTLAMLAAGPAILAMFPLWLIGVGAYRFVRRHSLRPGAGCALWLASLVGWVLYQVWAAHTGTLIGLTPGLLRRPELVQDYVVALLFTANLIGFAAMSPLLAPAIQLIAPLAQKAASLTFALYLMHMPVAQFLLALSPWPLASGYNRALLILGTMLGVGAIARLTERWKTSWRRAFYRCLDCTHAGVA